MNCCKTCGIYKKYTGLDFCCYLCSVTQGKQHDLSCAMKSCSDFESDIFSISRPSPLTTSLLAAPSLTTSGDDCCQNCGVYKKYSGLKYCCWLCYNTGGKQHNLSCSMLPCSNPKPVSISNPYSVPSSTQKLFSSSASASDLYSNMPSQRNIFGKYTKPSQNIQSPFQLSPTVTDECCPNCKIYKKYMGRDFCCRTCRDTNGKVHGFGCLRILCNKNINVNQDQQCLNLRTSQKIYDANTICFYDSGKPYYEFTNFYAAPITIDGVTYPTNEHYFQSQKFSDKNIINEILSNNSPRNALDTARKYSSQVRKDWHTGVKDAVMKKALVAKFTQYPNLRKKLMDTGNKNLVEHTTNDNYWGDNGDGTGTNRLGKLLMEVRNEISQGLI